MATQITSSDCVFYLGVVNVYNQPVLLSNYAADDIFDTENIAPGEFVMGADGYLTGGLTPVPTPMNIVLQADSPAIPVFDNWYLYQRQNKTLTWAFGTVTFPSLGKKFALDKGGLRGYKMIADAKKILQPVRFSIVWQNPQPAATTPASLSTPGGY